MYSCELVTRVYPLLLIFFDNEAVGSVRIKEGEYEKWETFVKSLNVEPKSDVTWLTK